MLPAETFAEITTAIAALQLAPDTAAQILAAVFAPLLRSSGDPKRAARPRSRAAPRRRKYQRRAPRDARERAIAALRAHPGATVSTVAKLAKVSFGTVINARKDLTKEARKEARRKPREASNTDAKTERRERAQRWLRDTLAQGPKEVQVVEAAAAKAHIDDVLLSQARADLGIIATRADSGGVHAVQWSLPG